MFMRWEKEKCLRMDGPKENQSQNGNIIYCPSCKWWKAGDPGGSECPNCGRELEEAPVWFRNLTRAWATGSTGPKTPAGKYRSSMNPVKNLLFSKIHKYFPARPGKYPECENCPHAKKCEAAAVCYLKNEMYNDFQMAFDSKDPRHIQKYFAENQAKYAMLRTLIFREIFQKGALIPIYARNKEGEIVNDAAGNPVISSYQQNPVLPTLEKMMGPASLSEFLVSPKSQKDKKEEEEAKTEVMGMAAYQAMAEAIIKNIKKNEEQGNG